MYTKEQLQAMSDFELNKALALMLPYTYVVGTGEYPSQSDSAVHVESRKSKYANIEERGADYCNSPNDIMPLQIAHNIGLTQPMLTHQDKWQANWFSDGRNYGVADHYMSHKNPLRAIACCLILVLQERDK